MIEKTLLQKYRYFSKLINGVRRGISSGGPGKYSKSYVCGPGHTPLIGRNIIREENSNIIHHRKHYRGSNRSRS